MSPLPGAATEVSPDILRAARETYDLELALAGGLSPEALEKAIAAGIRAQEQVWLSRVVSAAETYSSEMRANDDDDDFATALDWFAHKLRDDLVTTATESYAPNHGDIVEVTVTGSVVVWDVKCEGCGKPHEDHEWSVRDDRTGDEYFFRKTPPGRDPRVRILSRYDEEQEAA